MNWIALVPTAGAAFLASLVECVEAATIMLAVGTVRGWRSALAGMVLGLIGLLGIVLVLGPALSQLPQHLLQSMVGLLLLLFGMRWLRKAILRSAGVIALHDEEAVFRSETANLAMAAASARFGVVDPIAMVTAFKAVLLEGIEVAFIVLAVSAGGPSLLLAASAGALAAAVLVAAVAIAVHRPLARVPENTLKFAVGVVISAFGIYWTGEGMGIDWPGHDLALMAIAGGLLATALLGARLVRPSRTKRVGVAL
jgi:uncharacterized membrane protein